MNPNITLPSELFDKLTREANARGLSVDEFVRLSLERNLTRPGSRDSLFADEAVFDGDSPTDLAANHDAYLYED